MPKTHYVIAAMLGLIITTAVIGVTTFAQTNATALTPVPFEHRQEMQQALTDGDYETWSEIRKAKAEEMRNRATEIESNINQATFNKLTEAHQLMQAGKIDEAKAIFEEIGLPGPSKFHGMRRMRDGMHDKAGWRFNAPSPENTNN